MATRSKNRSKNRASRRSRSQRGGDQGSFPDSAWGFQMNNLGNGWTQFMNSMSVQPGGNLGTSQSNNIVPIKNMNVPVKMAGGRRRRSQQRQQMQQQQRSRGKKGGYWGAVLEQAAVPLALLGMQQFYGKRHSRRHPGHVKSFRRGH